MNHQNYIHFSWKIISEFKNNGWRVSCPYLRTDGTLCISCSYPGNDVPGTDRHVFFKVKGKEITVIYTGYHGDFTMARENNIDIDILDALDLAIQFIFDISKNPGIPRGFYFVFNGNWVS